MKKTYYILLILITVFASCTDKFEDFNTDDKNPSIVTGNTLFTNAQIALADQISTSNVNLNVWKLFSQYWTETQYVNEANYDIINRTVADNTYEEYYRDILRDLKEASIVISKEVTITDSEKASQKNRLLIIEILKAYCFNILVDTFGDIPYTEALDVNNVYPAYDNAFSICKDLIQKLDGAISELDNTNGSFGSTDLYYGGDVDAWKKFANSIKLKIGINLVDVDPIFAKSTIESAVTSGVFDSSADDALMSYLESTPYTNTLYEDIVLSGREDFVAANTIVDKMNELNDPRMKNYFSSIEGSYIGAVYGEICEYAEYSHASDKILQPTFPGILMTYYELCFYLAEAAQRGMSVGNTAEFYYNEGIRMSILWWGGTDSDVTQYLAQPQVAYTSGTETEWKEKIGTQAWIAFYTRGFEGYTSWRRLDFPILNMPSSIFDYSEIPVRFTYPIAEQTLNGDNYAKAAAAIGGDLKSTKLFWDKF